MLLETTIDLLKLEMFCICIYFQESGGKTCFKGPTGAGCRGFMGSIPNGS